MRHHARLGIYLRIRVNLLTAQLRYCTKLNNFLPPYNVINICSQPNSDLCSFGVLTFGLFSWRRSHVSAIAELIYLLNAQDFHNPSSAQKRINSNARNILPLRSIFGVNYFSHICRSDEGEMDGKYQNKKFN